MKKVISVVFITLCLLYTTAFADGIQLADSQKEDLYNLGIMTGDENGNLHLEDYITRAEAIKMICVAGNIPIYSQAAENPFDDVEKNHWAYNYINAAKKKEIINGDENRNFNPEDNITNEEIVKMITSMLGYGEMAEMKGGYPAGYTSVSSQLGIVANLKLNPNTPATRNDVAIMISNSLDIPIMVKKSENGDENAVYVILNGKNGLPFSTIRGTRGMIWDTSLINIDKKAQSFASQYPYKEGDTEKSFMLYPGITCLLGMEKTPDSIEYECPAIYDDRHAYELVNTIPVAPAEFVFENTRYETQYAIFNSKVLVPYDIFKLSGCEVLFDKNTYVATISKDDTTLEIIPNLVGMRKNKSEGYWVPLEICARFIEDILYVPLDAIAEEFGHTANTNLEESIITIK